jgi:hypothetical protein
MRPDRNPETIEVLSTPVVLIGPPEDLRGEVLVQNAGDARAVVRQIAARLEDTRQLAASQPREVTTIAPIVMRGAERGVRLLSFDFGRLGPGEYSGEVRVGARWYPARFQVAARDRVEVTPGKLVIESEPGRTVARTLIARNLGNTRRECRSTPDVYLEEEELTCATLRRTARALSREDERSPDEPSLGHIVGEYFRQGDAALKAAGRIAIDHDPVVLDPGDSAVVEVRFNIPRSRSQELDGRFVGVLRFFDSRIDIALRLYGGHAEPSEPPESPPAARKAAAKGAGASRRRASK